MIKLNIISCDLPDFVGEYTYWQNQLLIGGSQGDIAVYKNPNIKHLFLIEIYSEICLLHPGLDIKEFDHNHLSHNTSVEIKAGDIIEYKDFKFRIDQLEFETINNLEEEVLLNRKKINRDNPNLYQLLEELEHDI